MASIRLIKSYVCLHYRNSNRYASGRFPTIFSSYWACLTDQEKYTNIRIMEQQEWFTEFYKDENGAYPVIDFLERLDVKTRARFRWSMEQLRVRNVRAQYPLVRHLEGDLWELREESSTNIYRIVYFFFTGRRIIFLHGFTKKTRKTPTKELSLAKRRYQQFLAVQKGGDATV